MTNSYWNKKISHENAPDCCHFHQFAWPTFQKMTALVGKLRVDCNHKPKGWDKLDAIYREAKTLLED